MNSWPKHLPSLDISRSIAALAVVLVHWQHFIDLAPTVTKLEFPLFPILKILYNDGGQAVNYFFMLSGFIFFWLYYKKIKNGKVNFRRFGISRFARLYPLHFITLLICLVLQIIFFQLDKSTFVYGNLDGYHFFLNSTFIQYWGFQNGLSFNGPSWSVSIEILLYLTFFVIAMIRGGSLLNCLTIAIIAHILEVKIGAFFGLFHGITCFFIGGAVYYFAKILDKFKMNHLSKIFYSATIILWILTFTFYYTDDILSPDILNSYFFIKLINLFPAFILFPITLLSLILIDINKKRTNYKSNWFGQITYSSYLLHFPLQIIFAIFVKLGFISDRFFLEISSLFSFYIILIPISYLTYRYIERPLQLSILNNKIFSNKNANYSPELRKRY